MVVWLIGLSGAGKTTIGRHLYELWRSQAPNTVLVDGDEVRAIFGDDRNPADYTVEGRRRNNRRMAEICAWLDGQGINVICCTLSNFPERSIWNRETYSDYFEVYVTAPMEVLEARDTKGLYARARSGEMDSVVGVDIPFIPPERPDLTVDTSNGSDPLTIAAEILKRTEEVAARARAPGAEAGKPVRDVILRSGR